MKRSREIETGTETEGTLRGFALCGFDEVVALKFKERGVGSGDGELRMQVKWSISKGMIGYWEAAYLLLNK